MIAILRRDLALAFGAGGGFGQGLGFFLIVTFLMPLGIGPDMTRLAPTAPAVIWIAILLAGLLSLDRLIRDDAEDGMLAQIRLAPLPLASFILAKAASHWLTNALPMTCLTALIALMLGLQPAEIPPVIVSLVIGSPALSLLGTIGAALTLSVRKASLVLALITLPLYIPTLVFGTLAASPESDNPLPALMILGGITLLSAALAPVAAVAILKRQAL